MERDDSRPTARAAAVASLTTPSRRSPRPCALVRDSAHRRWASWTSFPGCWSAESSCALVAEMCDSVCTLFWATPAKRLSAAPATLSRMSVPIGTRRNVAHCPIETLQEKSKEVNFCFHGFFDDLAFFLIFP